MVDRCETTGDVLPESVVHLWGAADSDARDTSSDAVVVQNCLDELGGDPYDGNLEYDKRHTPRRPEQILHRVLVSLSHKQRVYETRFGKYHVLGNNCEHFVTWSRYGVNRSDQVASRIKVLGMGLGTLMVGVPGTLIGGYVTDSFIRSTYKTRRDESIAFESSFFENTEACEHENEDVEVDWTVECLIRSVEDFEKLSQSERAAHSAGRGHLPRGGMSTSSHERARGDGNAGGGSRNGNDAVSREDDSNVDSESSWTREVFSLDASGNVGGFFGEGLKAFGEGLRGVMRDDFGATATPGATETPGATATPGSRADPNPKPTSRGVSFSDDGAGGGSRPTSASSQSRLSDRASDRPGTRHARLKDAVGFGANLFGAVLGGVLKVGGALACEVAEQHERHRKRVEDETNARLNSHTGGSALVPGSNAPRLGPMVIEEIVEVGR
jgi:hypothetical protein